jgi:hypothetical protein
MPPKDFAPSVHGSSTARCQTKYFKNIQFSISHLVYQMISPRFLIWHPNLTTNYKFDWHLSGFNKHVLEHQAIRTIVLEDTTGLMVKLETLEKERI